MTDTENMTDEELLSELELDEDRPYVRIGYGQTKDGEETQRVVAEPENGMDKLQFARVLTTLQAENTLALLHEMDQVMQAQEQVQEEMEERMEEQGEGSEEAGEGTESS